MTRQEILDSYTICDGRIDSPGKFEGEPIYAPHFSEASDDGEILSTMEEGTGTYASLVEIDSSDRAEFRELGDAKYVLVEEFDSGFVSTTLVETEAEAEKIRNSYTGSEDEDDGESEVPLADFLTLYDAAHAVIDNIRLHVDHAEYTGGMNAVEDFREIAAQLRWKHAKSETN